MIYLIHFERKLAHAQHYLGFCEEGKVEERIERHKKGNGAAIMRAVVRAGISFEVVRVWENGTRDEERKLKNLKQIWRRCPICTKQRRRRHETDTEHNQERGNGSITLEECERSTGSE